MNMQHPSDVFRGLKGAPIALGGIFYRGRALFYTANFQFELLLNNNTNCVFSLTNFCSTYRGFLINTHHMARKSSVGNHDKKTRQHPPFFFFILIPDPRGIKKLFDPINVI